jgi:hypothetical protein
VSVPIIIDSFYSLWTLPCGLMGTIPQGTTDCVGESRQHRWWSRSERASPGQVLTAAAALGTGHLGTRRIIPVSHPLPKDPCVNLGSPTMGGSHQTQEKTQQSHLLERSPAFLEVSALCEERAVSSHSSRRIYLGAWIII